MRTSGRRFFPIVLVIALAGVTFPARAVVDGVTPPPNDSFASAAVIPDIPYQTVADTRGATRESGEPDCRNFAKNTVWYRFTAAYHLDVLMQMQTSRGGIGSAIYTGPSLSSLTLVSCGYSHHMWTAEPGNTYFLQVGPTFGDGDGLITMDLSFRHRVAGLVTDRHGVPQKNICADLRSEDGETRANIDLTSPDGRFEITGVLSGRYKLHFFDCDWYDSNEFMAEWYDDVQSASEADVIVAPDVKPSVTLAGFTAALTRGGTIAGSFTADARACLQAHAFPVGSSYASGESSFYTSEANSYRITGLPPGDYEVRFQECRSGDGGFIRLQDEWYSNVRSRDVATPVHVELESVTNGIDAHLEAIPPPPNDDYQNAIEITTLPFTHAQDVTTATIQTDELRSCGSSHSVWFKFEPESVQLLTIDALASNYWTGAALYRATGLQTGDPSQDLELITCDDEGLARSRFSRAVLPGDTYYVRIGHYLVFPEPHFGDLKLTASNEHWASRVVHRP